MQKGIRSVLPFLFIQELNIRNKALEKIENVLKDVLFIYVVFGIFYYFLLFVFILTITLEILSTSIG